MAPAAPVGVPAHVPLVRLLRGGMVEGLHHGSVVVLDPDGEVRFAAGDPDTAIYPRSAAKPMQAVAMVRLGLDLPADLLALAAASHSGEARHLAGVREVLAGVGRAEADLANPPALPLDPVERDEWIGSGRPPSRVAHNCSGKHAAMVCTAAVRGWSVEGYLSPGHPLQRGITATLEELTGERAARTAVDGCGAPLAGISLRGLARAAGRIAAAPEGTAEHRVARAMRSHPEMVAGTRRDTTHLMRRVPGLLAKDGFEGVEVAALPDGTSVALKIADGTDRARLPVTVAALGRAGVDPALLAEFRPGTGPDGLALVDDLVDDLDPALSTLSPDTAA